MELSAGANTTAGKPKVDKKTDFAQNRQKSRVPGRAHQSTGLIRGREGEKAGAQRERKNPGRDLGKNGQASREAREDPPLQERGHGERRERKTTRASHSGAHGNRDWVP